MEPPKSNSLLRALEGKPVGEHPDADLLTAFAEDSLLAREREALLAHLAVCAECREMLSAAGVEPVRARELELVAAAAPAAAVVSIDAEDRTRPKKKRLWPMWAAAAAACLALATVVAVRYGQKTSESIAIVREAPKTIAVNAPPPAPVPGVAMEDAQSHAEPQMRALKRSDAKDERKAMAQPEVAATAPAQPENAITAAPEAMTRDALSATNQAVAREQKEVTAESTQGIVMQDRQMQAAKPAAAGAAAPRALEPVFGGALTKSARAGFAPRTQWRINDEGHVERALGDGSWQRTLKSEDAKMHMVSVVGQTVWAGGENDILYRSQDDGQSWQRVALPQKNGAPHMIAHIRFESARAGTVEAADGTTWTTDDGGSTWN